MNRLTLKKLPIAVGAVTVASNIVGLAANAGPALQTLNNLTNTAEFTINNTYGQSFSLDGQVTAAITPFAAGGGANVMADFVAGNATLTTGLDILTTFP